MTDRGDRDYLPVSIAYLNNANVRPFSLFGLGWPVWADIVHPGQFFRAEVRRMDLPLEK